MEPDNICVTMSAKASASFNVKTEVLTQHIVTEESTTMFSLVSVDETTVVRRDQMTSIVVEASVMPEDYVQFETEMTTMIQ